MSSIVVVSWRGGYLKPPSRGLRRCSLPDRSRQAIGLHHDAVPSRRADVRAAFDLAVDFTTASAALQTRRWLPTRKPQDRESPRTGHRLGNGALDDSHAVAENDERRAAVTRGRAANRPPPRCGIGEDLETFRPCSRSASRSPSRAGAPRRGLRISLGGFESQGKRNRAESSSRFGMMSSPVVPSPRVEGAGEKTVP